MDFERQFTAGMTTSFIKARVLLFGVLRRTAKVFERMSNHFEPRSGTSLGAPGTLTGSGENPLQEKSSADDADPGSLQRAFEHPLLNLAAEFIHLYGVEGDYLEFGVFEGRSFASAYAALKKRQQLFQGPRRRFWAFDSFQGLPEPSGVDALRGKFLVWDRFFSGRGAQPTQEFLSKGQFACSRESFVANLRASGVDLADVEIVEGYFHESLTPELKRRHELTRAAIIHVDVDYYSSTVQVLEFVSDLIQDGTIIIFDDFFCYRGHPDKGERRAFTEFLAAHPEILATDWHHWGVSAAAFILNRRDAI